MDSERAVLRTRPVGAVRGGFTLIELLVVLVVVLILSLVTYPMVRGALSLREEGAVDVIGSMLAAGRSHALAQSTYVAIVFRGDGTVTYRQYVWPPFTRPGTSTVVDAATHNGATDRDLALNSLWTAIPGMSDQRVPGDMLLVHGNSPVIQASGSARPRNEFAVVFGPSGSLVRVAVPVPGETRLFGEEETGKLALSPSLLILADRKAAGAAGDLPSFFATSRLLHINRTSGTIIRNLYIDPALTPIAER